MSKEKEILEEEIQETEQTTEDTTETTETEETVSKKQYDDLNDKFVRLAAEYDNFRKRSA